ncbi:MAG: HIT family protein [Bryobacteraceae bacterium]
MDYLWSPWRYRYVSSENAGQECLFCRLASAKDDRSEYILLRAERNFVVLNRYPYTSGHLMIAPYAHVASLEEADPETLEENIRLARRMESALKQVYKPEGFNMGLNIGRCAGAGIAGHLHMHLLPRWTGDANFMTTTGETRVLPEDLETTYEKLKPLMAEPDPKKDASLI